MLKKRAGSEPPTWMRKTEARDRYRNRPSHPLRPHLARVPPGSQLAERQTQELLGGSSVSACSLYGVSIARALPNSDGARTQTRKAIKAPPKEFARTLEAERDQLRGAWSNAYVGESRQNPFEGPQLEVVLPSRVTAVLGHVLRSFQALSTTNILIIRAGATRAVPVIMPSCRTLSTPPRA